MFIDAKTDIGSTRSENQDNFWSTVCTIDGVETGIVCVCDGMGGLEDGGHASRMVIESIRDAVKSGVGLDSLVNVILKVNAEIYNMCSQGKRMGTTCTILYCQNNEYTIYHVGDSRCYKVDIDGSVYLLSTDHSVVRKYGITKQNNPELYEKYKSKLTNCIGVTPTVSVDTYRGNYSKGDTFILCSDGFWHSFDDNMCSMNLRDLCGCINTCINCGETDNITVSLLQIN